MSKLVLGTAQFGFNYGISNTSGKVSESEVRKILDRAMSVGVFMLDTAASYGDSEAILGRVGVSDFEIVTKLPVLPTTIYNVDKWVYEQILSSLNKLKVNQIYGLLLHKSSDFLGKAGLELYNALRKAQDDGLVKKIGVSIYSPTELDELEKAKISIDLVQAPLNVFDRRIQTSGWLRKLKDSDVEVHIRSVFLQGLLLLDSKNKSPFFDKWSIHFDNFEMWVKETGRTRIGACLSFVNALDDVDKIVVGAENKEQFIEIIRSINHNCERNVPSNLESDDLMLINPSNWR